MKSADYPGRRGAPPFFCANGRGVAGVEGAAEIGREALSRCNVLIGNFVLRIDCHGISTRFSVARSKGGDARHGGTRWDEKGREPAAAGRASGGKTGEVGGNILQ